MVNLRYIEHHDRVDVPVLALCCRPIESLTFIETLSVFNAFVESNGGIFAGLSLAMSRVENDKEEL